MAMFHHQKALKRHKDGHERTMEEMTQKVDEHQQQPSAFSTLALDAEPDSRLFALIEVLPLVASFMWPRDLIRFACCSKFTLSRVYCPTQAAWCTCAHSLLHTTSPSLALEAQGVSPEHAYTIIRKTICATGITIQELTFAPSLTSSGPPARSFHSVCVFRGMLIVFGGRISEDQFLNDLWMLNTDTAEWSNVKFGLHSPCPRAFHDAAVLHDRYLVIHGGLVPEGYRSNDTWLVDLNPLLEHEIALTWVCIGSGPTHPDPRFHHTFASNGNVCVIFGGHNWRCDELADTWLLTVTIDGSRCYWERIALHSFPSPRAWQGHTLFSGFHTEGVIVFGGLSVVETLIYMDTWYLELANSTQSGENIQTPLLVYEWQLLSDGDAAMVQLLPRHHCAVCVVPAHPISTTPVLTSSPVPDLLRRHGAGTRQYMMYVSGGICRPSVGCSKLSQGVFGLRLVECESSTPCLSALGAWYPSGHPPQGGWVYLGPLDSSPNPMYSYPRQRQSTRAQITEHPLSHRAQHYIFAIGTYVVLTGGSSDGRTDDFGDYVHTVPIGDTLVCAQCVASPGLLPRASNATVVEELAARDSVNWTDRGMCAVQLDQNRFAVVSRDPRYRHYVPQRTTPSFRPARADQVCSHSLSPARPGLRVFIFGAQYDAIGIKA